MSEEWNQKYTDRFGRALDAEPPGKLAVLTIILGLVMWGLILMPAFVFHSMDVSLVSDWAARTGSGVSEGPSTGQGVVLALQTALLMTSLRSPREWALGGEVRRALCYASLIFTAGYVALAAFGGVALLRGHTPLGQSLEWLMLLALMLVLNAHLGRSLAQDVLFRIERSKQWLEERTRHRREVLYRGMSLRRKHAVAFWSLIGLAMMLTITTLGVMLLLGDPQVSIENMIGCFIIYIMFLTSSLAPRIIVLNINYSRVLSLSVMSFIACILFLVALGSSPKIVTVIGGVWVCIVVHAMIIARWTGVAARPRVLSLVGLGDLWEALRTDWDVLDAQRAVRKNLRLRRQIDQEVER